MPGKIWKKLLNIRPLNKIALALLFIVVLPALFYSLHEIQTLNDNEKMISEIYRQQLDAILFSVNQYSWDVTNSWVSNIKSLLAKSPDELLHNRLTPFLESNRGIRAIFFSDSLASDIQIITRNEAASEIAPLQADLHATLSTQEALLSRLQRYKKAGYGKIEPVVFSSDTDSLAQSVALLFALEANYQRPEFQFSGIILDPNNFINEVLNAKLEEVAGSQFCLAVFQGVEKYTVFPDTAKVIPESAEQKKELWLLPEFYLGIYPQGQSINELARSRSFWDLVFILMLNAVLITGVWFVYRNIRKEMALAQLKSDFVSNISHELRTPLALIRMFTETLEMGRVRTEEKKHEYYKIIGQETERLTHLVNNILNFSRIEAGRKEYHFYDIDLNEITRKVLENYQFHLENEGFEVETDLRADLPPIKADQESVSESIINLLDNAVKYSDAHKFIRLKTGMENGAVFMEIEDRGIGISPENQEKIFEKFYRVSDALVHNTKGSGLGLSLVKHIMDAHGGKIIVKSKVGEGSLFRLEFSLRSELK